MVGWIRGKVVCVCVSGGGGGLCDLAKNTVAFAHMRMH